jgi:hypothetical protein
MTRRPGGRSTASQRNLGGMSADAADAPSTGSGSTVLVSQAVLDKMRDELPPATARAVAQAIVQIPQRQGVPMRLKVPGDPPGTQYYALLARGAPAPVVIYREALPGENGGWVVTALMNHDSYDQYRHGLADDPTVQGVAAAIAAAGTIPAIKYASRYKR